MKKHTSVLLLAVRSTVYKALGLLFVMGAAQTLLFWLTFRQRGDAGFESLLIQSRVSLVCGAGFLLYCALLCFVGCDRYGSKTDYTLRRLSVDEKIVVFWWAVSGFMFLLIFWAAQLGVVLILSRLYRALAGPVRMGEQALFLAFYRSPFLHSLLPLGEASRFVRNLLLLLSLGVSSACFGFRQRRGQKAFAMSLIAGITAVFFAREMGSTSSDIVLSLLALAVGGVAVYGLWGGVADEA